MARREIPARTGLTRVGILGEGWIVSVGAGAELRGVGTLASPSRLVTRSTHVFLTWEQDRTRATQASPPRIIPTPAPTDTKGLAKRHDNKPTRERSTWGGACVACGRRGKTRGTRTGVTHITRRPYGCEGACEAT